MADFFEIGNLPEASRLPSHTFLGLRGYGASDGDGPFNTLPFGDRDLILRANVPSVYSTRWKRTDRDNHCVQDTLGLPSSVTQATHVSSAMKLVLSGVRERPEYRASVLVHDPTKVHGDGEKENEEEKIDAKQGMQESAEGLWREQIEVHPYEGDDSQDSEHPDDDAGGAFGPVGGCEGLLDEGEFGVSISGVGLLGFGAHAGFLSVMRCLRRVVTP